MAAPIAAIGMGASALGGITGAVGSIFGGNANAAAYEYQAGIAQMNAKIAQQNAAYDLMVGETQAQESGMKTRAQVGKTRAVQGASGLDVNTGTNVRVRASEEELGAFDQAIIRSDASKRAYGDEVIAAQETAQSQLDTMAASASRTAGYIGAVSSILGAGSSVSSKWMQASQMGVF